MSDGLGIRINANFWINVCNPYIIDMQKDPWIFYIPIAFKPCFINMDFSYDNLHVVNFVSENSFKRDELEMFLGNHLDWSRISKLRLDSSGTNHWVWMPNTSSAKIPHVVYNFFNQCQIYNSSSWNGRHIIWSLHASPRVITFLWRLLDGRIPTFSYYYKQNIGHPVFCPFCDLDHELMIMCFGNVQGSRNAGLQWPPFPKLL